MALSIVRNDITRMKVDAIVNSTNERLISGGFGVDASVHYAAGPALAVALNKIGRCPTGSCVMTDAFEIPTCRFIIHAVGPVYGPPGGPETAETGQDGYALIEACYRSIYRLASEHGCRSVAVPLISAGANGFPSAEVYRIATSTARAFLLSRKADEDMRIFIVLYDEESIGVSRKVSDEIRHYISDEYRAEHVRELQSCMYLRSPGAGGLNRKPRSVSVLQDMSLSYGTECQAGDKEDYRAIDKSFPEMCEWWCSRKKISKHRFYTDANITKATFWAIKKHPDRAPKKTSALACAIGLRLDLDQTKDLLARAGQTLSPYFPLDRIVESYIAEKCFDIDEINAVLFDEDLALLGTVVK